MLKVWGRSSAYNVQKVLWFIAELGLDYEHADMGSTPGDLDSEKFLAMNPHGRVPVLMDIDRYIWESNTILRYLSSTYGRDDYWVEDSFERTLIERWMDWELASLQPDFLSLFWKYYRTPENKRDSNAIAVAMKRCDRNMLILDRHLENCDYVAGSHFSCADICVGTSFYRYFNMGVEVAECSHVVSWYKKLSARPAYKKHIIISFEGLRGRLNY